MTGNDEQYARALERGAITEPAECVCAVQTALFSSLQECVCRVQTALFGSLQVLQATKESN